MRDTRLAKLILGKLKMAGAQRLMQVRGDEKFVLTFNQQTAEGVSLVRKGGEDQAINKPPRIMSNSDFNKESERGEVPRVDFLTDSNGKVITGNNFGLSVFTETDFLPKPLRRGPLWQLDNKTPFPEELGLYFDTSSHGIIAPTQPVTPSTVQKMLRCLHWRKIQSQQPSAR